jgi:hypothetical protein
MNPGPPLAEKWIALTGKRDAPVDGVEDYCSFLAAALRQKGVDLQRERVAWDEVGWSAALKDLTAKSGAWRGRWVLLQFTSLAWSARGFPLPALEVLDILEASGARVAIVFHEASGQAEGRPVIQPIRAAFQNFVIRDLHRRAAKSIFTVPLSTIPWLSANDPRATFIPIGANIPQTLFAQVH